MVGPLPKFGPKTLGDDDVVAVQVEGASITFAARGPSQTDSQEDYPALSGSFRAPSAQTLMKEA